MSSLMSLCLFVPEFVLYSTAFLCPCKAYPSSFSLSSGIYVGLIALTILKLFSDIHSHIHNEHKYRQNFFSSTNPVGLTRSTPTPLSYIVCVRPRLPSNYCSLLFSCCSLTLPPTPNLLFQNVESYLNII